MQPESYVVRIFQRTKDQQEAIAMNEAKTMCCYLTYHPAITYGTIDTRNGRTAVSGSRPAMSFGNLPSIRAALTVAVAVALAAHAGPSWSVQPQITNVQVNQVQSVPFSTNKQNEPALAQNPTNLLNLVAGANDQSAEPACTDETPSSCKRPPYISVSGFYASFDGGATWPCQGLIDLSQFGEYAFGDPSLAFDSKGNAYYGTLAFPIGAVAGAEPSDLFVAKSTDGGCTWTSSAKASGPARGIFDDKDAIAADANPSSPFRDNVYAAWTKLAGPTHPNQVLFARSTDGGTTWSLPVQLSPADTTATTYRGGAAVKVGPDGKVYVLWVDTKGNPAQPPAIHLTLSHDGGQTFLHPGQDIIVAPLTDDLISPLPGASFRDGGRIFPSMAVGPDGALYVVWGNHTNGHAVVLLSHSTDSGLSWSAPVVAGDVVGRSAFFASVTVGGDGVVNVVFQALDDKPKDTPPGAGVVHYDTYLTQSADRGASFGSPLVISTTSSDPDGSSLQGLGAQFLGDYITAVADAQGGKLFAVWTDARNASRCTAVDAFRAGTGPKPNVIQACPINFGNTDIFLGTVLY